MKKLILMLVASLVLASGMASAQSGKVRRVNREKVAEDKKAYLTKELNLTPDEASKVMEVLTELDQQRFRLWQESKEIRERIRKKDLTLTDSELKHYFEKKLEDKIKEAELERSAYKKLATVISVRKLVLLDYAEKRFARRYLPNMKELWKNLKTELNELKDIEIPDLKGLAIPHEHEH